MDRYSADYSIGEETRLIKIPSIDIEFEDLNYFVQTGSTKLARKQILKSINGKFLSGELTGILGASGAGKTTLLNILAGYVVSGAQGSVKINGKLRQMDAFHKLSTYIMQEDLIQPYLTVKEEMMVAANLKLGKHISAVKKESIVEEVLKVLGLSNGHETRVERLSGGERKRLSIALELVSNPPIIFLDEPTTGLDSVGIKQCIDVLRTLTGEGRTVICTIHQPSVAIMQQFHQVYFIASGMCIYNGPATNMALFLNSIQLECPLTYSHAEFMIEVAETNPVMIPALVKATNNGKNYVKETTLSTIQDGAILKEDVFAQKMQFSTSFWTQLYVILGRMLLQQRRNKLGFWIQLGHHTGCALLFGCLFYGVGNQANHVFTNFKLCLCLVIFFLYTHVMIPILLFPFEVKILKREYFNRWYGLKAYYTAVTLRNIPLVLFLGLECLLITYFMSDQPFELIRFSQCSLTCILVGLTSEAVGLAIGSVFNCRNGSVFGPALISPWVFFSIYGLGYSDEVGAFMRVMMGTSFVRYGVVAMVIGLFNNREFYCAEEEIYCHYKNSNHVLRDLGMLDTTYEMQTFGLVTFLVLFRLIAYIGLRLRLNPEWPSVFINLFFKIVRSSSAN